jgi:4a-hydroxytetrahydrobiopterin dehydratase
VAVLGDEEIERRLGDLSGWNRDGDALKRQLKFDDFQGSVDFLNRITRVAEEMNHHPDVCISWNTVDLTLSSHSEGGITENDFKLAAEIDSLA